MISYGLNANSKPPPHPWRVRPTLAPQTRSFFLRKRGVGGHRCAQCGQVPRLQWYPVAGVAFGAPGTCKQCTTRATANCGGAQGQPAPKLQGSLAPANSIEGRLQPNAQTHLRPKCQNLHRAMPTYRCAAVWPCNTAGPKCSPWGRRAAPLVWRTQPHRAR